MPCMTATWIANSSHIARLLHTLIGMQATPAYLQLTLGHWMQDVHVRVQRELAVLDQPMSTVGDVAMGLEVTFLNSAVDSVGKAASAQYPVVPYSVYPT